jgi:hypothetical protein
MARHHFVSQFLLRNWATAGKLVTYYFVHAANKVIERNASVASACQIRDLNSYLGLRAPHRDFPETALPGIEVDRLHEPGHGDAQGRGKQLVVGHRCPARWPLWPVTALGAAASATLSQPVDLWSAEPQMGCAAPEAAAHKSTGSTKQPSRL